MTSAGSPGFVGEEVPSPGGGLAAVAPMVPFAPLARDARDVRGAVERPTPPDEARP